MASLNPLNSYNTNISSQISSQITYINIQLPSGLDDVFYFCLFVDVVVAIVWFADYQLV